MLSCSIIFLQKQYLSIATQYKLTTRIALSHSLVLYLNLFHNFKYMIYLYGT